MMGKWALKESKYRKHDTSLQKSENFTFSSNYYRTNNIVLVRPNWDTNATNFHKL